MLKAYTIIICNLNFNTNFGTNLLVSSFFIGQMSGPFFSYLEKEFISVKHLKIEVYCSAQYVWITKKNRLLLNSAVIDAYF